mmetsp:Transcript_50714/g.69005  ORF Transcript_50714/g.69005 Transcript_50714/m.69005 type:complete len:627 (-) Transcript_50714:101-1981(-)|eukprot:CAMPEP_0185778922 /NCGR_PEP_ID=MMETSP1174-20130828/94094_1 /TAXON_ID=35687 /ORGANISM="Dictyocha speculum, Strain CCMP1381" /LENGTH=626 /DNA_ID=CAMNT_0028467845 /DNA_START=60 /DNA_END=1940 /DNA_ORIENTATION=+
MRDEGQQQRKAERKAVTEVLKKELERHRRRVAQLQDQNAPAQLIHAEEDHLSFLEKQFAEASGKSVALLLGDIDIDGDENDLRCNISCDLVKESISNTNIDKRFFGNSHPRFGSHANQERGLGKLCRCSCSRVLALAAVSNLSSAYNVASLGIALTILVQVHGDWKASERSMIVISTMYLGMITGQLIMGLIGDWLGAVQALRITLIISIIGALGSAFSPERFLLLSLVISQFLLGMGAGGIYPLAATMTAASGLAMGPETVTSKSTTPRAHSRRQPAAVAFVFSMQGLGLILTPLVAWGVVQLPMQSSAHWRLILGLGALPGLGLVWIRVIHLKRVAGDVTKMTMHGPRLTSWKRLSKTVLSAMQAFRRPRMMRKLIGLAGCWFLQDLTFYGNILFQTSLLQDIFSTELKVHLTIQEAIVASIAFPGCLMAVFLMDTLGPKTMQMQGFLICGLLYLGIGHYYELLQRNSRPLLIFFYGLTFFFSNFGPTCTTFILPSQILPSDTSSTFNGLAAACGNMGALIGATWMEPLGRVYGVDFIMTLCGVVSLLGFLLTMACIDDTPTTLTACTPHKEDTSHSGDAVTAVISFEKEQNSDEEYVSSDEKNSEFDSQFDETKGLLAYDSTV